MLSVRAKASNGASLVDRGFRRVYLRKREREYSRWRPGFFEGVMELLGRGGTVQGLWLFEMRLRRW